MEKAPNKKKKREIGWAVVKNPEDGEYMVVQMTSKDYNELKELKRLGFWNHERIARIWCEGYMSASGMPNEEELDKAWGEIAFRDFDIG